jgi:hypothetical protein
MNFDVFISYPHQDKAAADAACAKLEAHGIRCWIAPRDVPPGKEWAEAIVDAIDHCRAMVLIFSSSTNKSKQIHREVQRAFDNEVPVVPFRIENVLPEKFLSYYMGSVHWLDALTPPFEQHLQKLADSVKPFVQVKVPDKRQDDEPAPRETRAPPKAGQGKFPEQGGKEPAPAPARKWSPTQRLLLSTCLLGFILVGSVGVWFGADHWTTPVASRPQVAEPSTPLQTTLANPDTVNPGTVMLKNGLVGYWPFNSRTTNWMTNTTQDLSGKGHIGSLRKLSTAGSMTDIALSDQIGKVLSFNGDAGFVAVASSPNFQPLTGDWSVAFWIYRLGGGVGDFPQVIGSRPWFNQYDKGWAVSYANISGMLNGGPQLGHLCAHFADGGSGFDVNSSSQSCSGSVVALRTWQHWTVVFSRSAGLLWFYKDGMVDAQRHPAFPAGTVDQENSVFIAREVEGSNARGLNAAMHDLRVYNRALSQQEAKELFLEGK